MTKNLVYLILTIMILKLCSCNDPSIAEIKNSKDKDKVDSLYSLVTFNFFNENLTIPTGGNTPIWTAIKPEKLGKAFIPVNNGYLMDIIITNYYTENGLITIYPLYGFPITLKNSIIDQKNQLILQFDSKNLNSGLYEDMIYFNNTKHLGFKVTVSIK